MPEKVKRGRGRPRIHPNGTEVVSFRARAGVQVLLQRAIATVKLFNQQVDESDAAIIVEALKVRLKGLENRNPEGISRTIASLDAWLQK